MFRSDPVLDADGDGRFYYYSLGETPPLRFLLLRQRRTDLDRSEPAFGGDKQWFTIDRTDGAGRGNIYVSWSTAEQLVGERIFIRSTDGGRLFGAGRAFDPPRSGGPSPSIRTAVSTSSATPTSTTTIFVVYRSLDAWDAGVDPTFDAFTLNLGGRQADADGPNPVGLLGQVWIAANHSDGPDRGDLYVVASVDPPGGDPQDVHFVRSTDRGETWSSAAPGQHR